MDTQRNPATDINGQQTTTLDSIVPLPTDNNYPSGVFVMDIIINCGLVHICAVVGSFGNIVTLIVISRSDHIDTSNILLMSMAACDLFLLVNLSCRKLDCFLERFDPIFVRFYHPYVVTYIRMPGRISVFISLSHVVIISYERLLAVFYPLQIQQWITVKTMIAVLVFTYAACFITCVPWTFLRFQIDWVLNDVYNKTLPVLKETEWFIANRRALDIVADLILNNINVLLLILVTANCCAIAYKLRQVSKQRRSLTSSWTDGNRSDLKVSRMLLVVCVVFCFCSLSSVAVFLYFYLDHTMVPPNKLFALLSDVDELVLAFNSAANFFVYVCMSSKFYNSVIDLLKRCTARKKKMHHRTAVS